MNEQKSPYFQEYFFKKKGFLTTIPSTIEIDIKSTFSSNMASILQNLVVRLYLYAYTVVDSQVVGGVVVIGILSQLMLLTITTNGWSFSDIVFSA